VRGGGGDSPRLRSVERKLNLILTQLGVDPDQGLDSQLKDLVRAANKIEAIKRYRQQTGVGLKEAKEHIEGQYGASARRRQAVSPQPVPGPICRVLVRSETQFEPGENILFDKPLGGLLR
jgi:hypothetical protein